MKTLHFYLFSLQILLLNTLLAQPTLQPHNPNLPNNPNSNPDRRIFWIHGLGGDPDITWQKAGSWTQTEYKAMNDFPHYTETGLLGAGQNLLNQIKDKRSDSRDQDFIIAHSQGGLVSRSASYQAEKVNKEENPFGGIVTFGSPHGGAIIIDNIDLVVKLIEEGCNVLVGAEFKPFIESNFFLDLLFDAEKLLANVGTKACSAVAGLASANFKDFQVKIGEDYKYSNPSPYFSTLQEHNSAVHKVAFWGEETNPVLLRLLYSLTHSPEEDPLWGAGNDNQMAKSMEDILQDYEAKRNSELEKAKKANDKRISCIFQGNPICYNIETNKMNEHNESVAAINKAINWLKSLDEKWKTVIGANGYAPTYDLKCKCEHHRNGEYIQTTYSSCPSDKICKESSYRKNGWSIQCSCVGVEGSKFIGIEPSDGVVLKSSAVAFPGVFRTDIMSGSNHQQMRNDGNTLLRLSKLLNGGYGDFFRTKTR